ncbi:MAG: phage scaffolding protein [Ktedonobacterales bacterium]
MSDLNTQVVSGQPQMSQPPVGGATPNDDLNTTQTSQVGGGEQSTLTLEQALRELANVRREAAEHRVARRALETEKAEAEQAKLSKEEQLAAKLAEAEKAKTEIVSRTQERMLAYETKIAATELNLVDPEAALKLLDASRIEFAEDGSPKNLVKLLKELVAAKPYLVAQQNQPAKPTVSPSSPTNPASGAGHTNTITEQYIASLSPEEYQKQRAAIFQARREGRILPN